MRLRTATNPWRLYVQIFYFLAAFGLATEDLRAQSSNNFWRAQSIYQIMTDRFYDGDTNNDNAEGTYAPGNPTGVHGGDFEGLEQKLDYIKALGGTAIWISPIVLNTEGQFHGYSAWNFYEVAPHWGSISNLQHMVQAAHARGLLVIDDIVLNHAGDLVTGSGPGWPNYNYPAGYTLSYVNSSKTYPTPFNLTAANPSLTNLFHNYGDIDSYNNSQEVVLGWLDGLNDFRTETPYVRSNMIAIYEYWINQIGFDAFRVDTVLEVDQGCWQSFCPAIYSCTATNVPSGAASANTNFFMFGEVDNGSESIVGPYTGTEAGGPYEFESTEDYPLYYDLNNVFATLSGDTEQIQNHYNDVQAYYDPTTWAQQVIFLDNQDNPRFLSTSESNGNTNALKMALAFLYTSVGIPCLYYGTEQGFDGTTDPDDREDLFAGEFKDGPGGTVVSLNSPGIDNFNMTHPLFQWVAQMNNFRRLYPAISLGSYVNQGYNSSGPGLFAYSRILNTQEVFVVFNTASSSQTLPARTLTYPTGTMLLNLLNTNETYTLTTGSQTPAITVPSTTAKIFIAQSQWQPLDPVVISNSPAHWTTNVTTVSPVVLQFSEPMNTNSVQTAFSTSPSVNGTFGWSATGDTMTFTPNAPGFPPSTNITVTVTNSAFDAVSGNTMVASYTLMFQTAAAPPTVYISSPASDGSIITMTSNTTYLIQACFTPTLDTNDPSLFTMTINGVLQPSSSFIFRPVGSIAGCPGLRSLLYNWTANSPGTTTGTNIIQVVYYNSNTGVTLSDTRTVIIPPPLVISGVASNNQLLIWDSAPGVNYQVLATTNLAQPFTPISGNIPGTGTSTFYYDYSTTNAPQKFYEIEAVP
jgi:glycosidase